MESQNSSSPVNGPWMLLTSRKHSGIDRAMCAKKYGNANGANNILSQRTNTRSSKPFQQDFSYLHCFPLHTQPLSLLNAFPLSFVRKPWYQLLCRESLTQHVAFCSDKQASEMKSSSDVPVELMVIHSFFKLHS